MIGGLETALTRWTPLARRAALPAAIIAVVALFGFSIWLIGETGAAAIVEQSSVYATRLDATSIMIGATVLSLQTAPTIDDLFHQLNPGRFASVIARGAGAISWMEPCSVLIYLGFMLASREGFGRQGRSAFPRRGGHAGALEVAGPNSTWRPELCLGSDGGRPHHRRRLGACDVADGHART